MQNLFNFENVYLFALQVGITLIGILIVSYLVCWLCQWVWAWLDDERVGPDNLLIKLVRKEQEYRYPVEDYDGEKNYFYSNAKEDSGKRKRRDKMVGTLLRANRRDCPSDLGLLILCSLGCVVVPLALAIVYDNLHISLCIAGFFALAHITRAGRRGQKLLKSHVEDKALHNKE